MLVLALCALLSPVAVAQEAPTGPSIDLADEADLHFRRGIEHYREGRFDLALEHLLMSNRLVPNRNVVFNVARAYEKLNRFEEAFRHFSEYVAHEPDPARRRLGEESIERIRGQLALVHITSDPPGASVFIDRKDLGARGRTPVSLALPPGEHAVILELDGHTPGQSTVDAVRGEEKQVAVDLPAILGSVEMAGSPVGATIRKDTEDGPVVGTLPGTIQLPPGPHVLVLQADGHHTVRQVVTVEADQTINATTDLPLLTGTLVVNAPERDALVEINGKAAGFTPAVLEVPVGEHDLKVSLRGYRPFEQTIRIEPDDDTTVEVQLRSLREVTAASRSAQSVEDAPASVTIITAEEIRAFQYQDLYQALGGVRGMFQSNDLTYKYLGVRGFSRPGDYGNRVLTTVDGHTMNDDQLGASYVATDFISDLHDVEQIEVVRGPGSALYGSNAFFGVVNVVTRDGETNRGPHATVTADQERTLRARLGTGFGGEKAGGWMSLSGIVGQGRDYFFEEYATRPKGNGGRSELSDGLYGGTAHAKLWAGDFTFQGFYHGRVKQFPNGAFGTKLGDPRNASNDFRGFAELRYEPELSEKTRLHTRVWLDQYSYLGNFPYGVAYVYQDTWRGAWVGFEPRLVSQVTDWLGFTLGAEGRNHFLAQLISEELPGLAGGAPWSRPLYEEPTFQVYSGYGIAEVGGKALRLSLGGRMDVYRTPEAVEEDFASFNPRAALILKPNEDNIVKLMGGTAFRAPSPYEYLYHDGGITQNPAYDLTPERILTVEGEYVRRIGEATSVTLAGYHNAIEGLVDQVDAPDGTFHYSNNDDVVRTVGVEYELRRDWQRGWMAVVQHSMQHSRVGDLLGDVKVTGAPEHMVSFKGAAPLVPGVSTISTVLRAESPRLTGTGDHTPWAVLWDTTLVGDLPGTKVTYGLGVRNLLDWRYTHIGGPEQLMDQVLQPGRSLFATITTEL